VFYDRISFVYLVELVEPLGASVECALCKYVVGYVDTVIQNNKSEAAIEAALEKVCTILPHALNSSCVQFVETFGPTLVQLIEKYGTPEAVCAALKLCHNGTEEIKPGMYYLPCFMIEFHLYI
jgi:saposin